MSEAGDGSDIYKLYAVVVHVDMLNASFFGHYICYIKDFQGNWYRIDDGKVDFLCLTILGIAILVIKYSEWCAWSLAISLTFDLMFSRSIVWNWRRFFLREHICFCTTGIPVIKDNDLPISLTDILLNVYDFLNDVTASCLNDDLWPFSLTTLSWVILYFIDLSMPSWTYVEPFFLSTLILSQRLL